jgi:hypothetical protein
MKVTVQRSGGFVGGLPQTFSVDADDLADGERAELRRLMDAAAAAGEPGGGSAADAFQYRVTVDTADASTTLQGTDTTGPDVRRLAQWVIEHARG